MNEANQHHHGEHHTHGSAQTNAAKGTSVRDPVCGMNVDPATAKYRQRYAGGDYYFCSAKCEAKFAASPEQYVTTSYTEPAGPTAPPTAAVWATYSGFRGRIDRWVKLSLVAADHIDVNVNVIYSPKAICLSAAWKRCNWEKNAYPCRHSTNGAALNRPCSLGAVLKEGFHEDSRPREAGC